MDSQVQKVNVSIQWDDGRRECYYGVGFTQDNVASTLGVELGVGVVRRIPQSCVISYKANQRCYTAEGIREFDVEIQAKASGLGEVVLDPSATVEIRVVADPRPVEEVMESINLQLALETMTANSQAWQRKAAEAEHAIDLFRGERDNLFGQLKNERAKNEQLQLTIDQYKRTAWETDNRLKNKQAEADHFRTTLGKVIARRDELQKLLEEARQIAAERTTQLGELQTRLDNMVGDRNRMRKLYEDRSGELAQHHKAEQHLGPERGGLVYCSECGWTPLDSHGPNCGTGAVLRKLERDRDRWKSSFKDLSSEHAMLEEQLAGANLAVENLSQCKYHYTAEAHEKLMARLAKAEAETEALRGQLDQQTKDLPAWDELQMLKDIREAITVGKQERYRTDDVAEAVMGVLRPCKQHLLHMNTLCAEWRSKHDELRKRMARYLADTCCCLHCSTDAGAEPDILDTYMNRIAKELSSLLKHDIDQGEKVHSLEHQIKNLKAQLSCTQESVERHHLEALCKELGIDPDPGDVPDPNLRLAARVMSRLTDLRNNTSTGLMETWRRLACKAVGLDVEYVVAKMGTQGAEEAINRQNELLAAVRGIATRYNVDQASSS